MLKVYGEIFHTKFKNLGLDFPARWHKMEIKPSNFPKAEENNFSPSEIQENATIHVSYICCGGNSDGSYSMFLFEGEKKKFSSLLSELSNSKRGQSMKRVVSNNSRFILFEMMDGSLFEFDTQTLKMHKFFISHTSLLNCVGSGIMSTCWLVQTIDGTIYEKEEMVENIHFPFPEYRVKQFACCSTNNAQFILLENNRLFIRKNGIGFGNVSGELNELKLSINCGIKKMVGGFSHLALLLEDGKIYCAGLNNSKQCTGLVSPRIVKEFQPIKIEGPFSDVCCSSMSTAVRSATHFHLLKEEPLQIAIENEKETIVFGRFHGFIYQRTFFETKSSEEIIFFTHLKGQLNNLTFSDISIFY